MNFHTMEIGEMDTDTNRMADPDDWAVESGNSFNGDVKANPDDWADNADNVQLDPPPSRNGIGEQATKQPEPQRPQDREDMPPEAPSGTKPSVDPYNDVALKKTVSAERTGSALTTQTIPETPPRHQLSHTIEPGRSIPMDNMVAKNFSPDADSNRRDPEQPDDAKPITTATPKPPSWNRIYCFLLTFLLVAIAGALGGIAYIQFFHKVGMETKAPTTEPSVSPTELPSSLPTLRPTTLPSSLPTNRPSTPAPTTRPPTSPPSRSPSTTPSISPSNIPSEIPSLSPTSVEVELRNLLARITDGRTIQAIDTPGTPQQLAYEWLFDDPGYLEFKQSRIVQRFAMAVLYYSTVGSRTSTEAMATWLDYDTNECTWFTSWYENRIPCGSDNIFKTLVLRNVELTGKIPSEIVLLTHLNTLVLSDNVLTGSLPKEFGQWDSLIKLDLHSNFVTGTIPKWTNTPNLNEINLGNNRLSGNVPSSTADLNLTSLDLAGNNVQGVVPPELCTTAEQQSQITLMTVDCEKVTCACCTQCGANRTRAPALAPFAAPPSPAPTKDPYTPAPTMSPSIFSISTMAPTMRATPGTTGCNSIQFSKQCYNVGEPIQISFYNCNPVYADWLGLYAAQTPIQNLQDPYLWHRSCGNKACFESPIFGSSIMDGSAAGLSSWPLPAGTYKVYLIRNTANKPYQAAFGSQEMRVSQSGCPN